jgi:hypothetical protein
MFNLNALETNNNFEFIHVFKISIKCISKYKLKGQQAKINLLATIYDHL